MMLFSKPGKSSIISVAVWGLVRSYKTQLQGSKAGKMWPLVYIMLCFDIWAETLYGKIAY